MRSLNLPAKLLLYTIDPPSHDLRTPYVLMYSKEQEYNVMSLASHQKATVTHIHLQEGLVITGHGTGVKNPACNDEAYDIEATGVGMVVSVLGNVLVGSLLLTGMFYLPHLIGFLLI